MACGSGSQSCSSLRPSTGCTQKEVPAHNMLAIPSRSARLLVQGTNKDKVRWVWSHNETKEQQFMQAVSCLGMPII